MLCKTYSASSTMSSVMLFDIKCSSNTSINILNDHNIFITFSLDNFLFVPTFSYCVQRGGFKNNPQSKDNYALCIFENQVSVMHFPM